MRRRDHIVGGQGEHRCELKSWISSGLQKKLVGGYRQPLRVVGQSVSQGVTGGARGACKRWGPRKEKSIAKIFNLVLFDSTISGDTLANENQ